VRSCFCAAVAGIVSSWLLVFRLFAAACAAFSSFFFKASASFSLFSLFLKVRSRSESADSQRLCGRIPELFGVHPAEHHVVSALVHLLLLVVLNVQRLQDGLEKR
jgi:hypothetical protein